MEKIRNKRYLIAIALATAVVCVLVIWPPAAIESVYPLERVRTFLTRRLVPSVAAMFRASFVSAENARLRREVAALALARSDAERLEAENAKLREVLNFRSQARGRWIPAEVLSFDGGAAGVRRIVRLARGSLDGVVREAAVVVPEGIVGRVVSVSPHTCAVMLVTDPMLRIACEIETAAGGRPPRGILEGGDGEHLVLQYLTRAAGLSAARQRVVTSGLGDVFPRGIFVGYLVGREGSAGSVRLGADLSSFEFAFIRRED